MPLRPALFALAVALVAALAACRPEVETEVPCGQEVADDLACPTGYHCGAEGLCEEGEAPPRVRFVRPQEGDTLTGLAKVSFHASCPRTLAPAALRLEKGGAKVADLALEVVWDTDQQDHAGLFSAALDTAPLDDGDYQFVATAKASTSAPGAIDTTELRLAVKVRRAN